MSNGGVWRFDDEPVIEEFDCGEVEFLIGFVTGRIHSRVLTPDAEAPTGPPVPFRPEGEQWLALRHPLAAGSSNFPARQHLKP